MIYDCFAWPPIEGILQWCSWRAGATNPSLNLYFLSYSIQSSETYLSENKITSVAYGSKWVVKRSFNDAIDELFQHTLSLKCQVTPLICNLHKVTCMNTLVMMTSWKTKLFIILPFAWPLIEGILQWCSWQAGATHPYSNFCFSIFFIFYTKL